MQKSILHIAVSIISLLLYLSGRGLSFISSVSTSFSDSGSLSPCGSAALLIIGVELLLTILVSAVTPGANH